MGTAIKKTSSPAPSAEKKDSPSPRKEASTEVFGRLVHQVVSGPAATNYKQDKKP